MILGEKMKKKTLIIGILLLTVILSACAPTSGTAVSETRTVSINGTGKIPVPPDMATISVGVQTKHAEAEEAMAENNVAIQAVMDTLSEFGIEPEDIKTSNFSVYPRNEYDNDGKITSTTFVVSNNVSVKVRDLDILGKVLAAVVESGANTVSGVNFNISDREAAYADAMALAVENARSRAEILVEAAGGKLGEVQSINAHISGGGVVYMERAAMDSAMASSEVPVSAGEMDLSVDVSVVYEIK